jgi:hypothetical protein
MSCTVIVVVVVVTAVRKTLRETNVSLNQCPALPNPMLLTKPLNHSSMCTEMVSVTNITFGTAV